MCHLTYQHVDTQEVYITSSMHNMFGASVSEVYIIMVSV